jgi:hypothetical protein
LGIVEKRKFLMGRYDIATGRKPTPEELHKEELEAKKPVNVDEGQSAVRVRMSRPLLTKEEKQKDIVYSFRGSLSKNFVISGPNGFWTSIPLDRLSVKLGTEDVYNDERQLVLTLPTNIVKFICDDVAAANRTL